MPKIVVAARGLRGQWGHRRPASAGSGCVGGGLDPAVRSGGDSREARLGRHLPPHRCCPVVSPLRRGRPRPCKRCANRSASRRRSMRRRPWWSGADPAVVLRLRDSRS